ncbi:PspC domain-containing protein [Lichenicola cladoniae]|uniref:PspC domain-containing protein n=1 Tax=Lichenicola cladoniae TaxID=1484109 RepID=A0A6M8HVH8_9PROT|nr:PspC domain-containing protein [Lichenicola cladoniae]NPD69479.1 PspC domain-containing protein [Acetobacteraceae bacterium]QKE92151.1 PspC domain-containing protein [Lichenicola cladoniae]
MNDPFPHGIPPRFWRQDKGAVAAGICAGLAEDLDLPLPLIRAISVIFMILPTGLAYLALAMLLRRRLPAQRSRYESAGQSSSQRRSSGAGAPLGQSWALLQHRFETLEPRLKNIEAFVTSSDFELHRGFGRMGK